MNPGGDFGKKELSPALRNRFTENWCTAINSDNDLQQIATKSMAASYNCEHQLIEKISKASF
jgi:midasin